MNLDQSFEVEKIVGKKIKKNGKVEYKIKWVGFSSRFNEWVPINKMNCDEKIKEYETSLFTIIGAKMSADGMIYALYEKSAVKLMASAELVQKYPESLVLFLESHVEFNWAQHDPLVISNENNNNNIYISACTNQSGQGIKYLLSRNDTRFFRIMKSRLAVEHAPNMVVGFLESKLDLNDCNPLPKNKRYATRGFIRQIDELQVSLFPKVKVERSLALERHLLTQPQENGPNQARRSLPAQALRVCKNVPIGARGRKRKTLQFIGCAPNPDGRQLKQPVPSSPVRQQEPESSVQPANRTNVRAKSTQNASVLVDHLGSPFYQPAKRTYSRATSTPFAGANETSLNVTFDESFGRLHYDSSDSE